MTDIEIAKQFKLQPIEAIAEKLGVASENLEQYGKKAKNYTQIQRALTVNLFKLLPSTPLRTARVKLRLRLAWLTDCSYGKRDVLPCVNLLLALFLA
jgi:hypothetical protein